MWTTICIKMWWEGRTLDSMKVEVYRRHTHTHTHSRTVRMRMCVKSKTFTDHLLYSVLGCGEPPPPSFLLPQTPSLPTRGYTHTHAQSTLLQMPNVLFSSLWEGSIWLWRVLLKSCSRPISSSVFKRRHSMSVFMLTGASAFDSPGGLRLLTSAAVWAAQQAAL